jgi:hypothetical protein
VRNGKAFLFFLPLGRTHEDCRIIKYVRRLSPNPQRNFSRDITHSLHSSPRYSFSRLAIRLDDPLWRDPAWPPTVGVYLFTFIIFFFPETVPPYVCIRNTGAHNRRPKILYHRSDARTRWIWFIRLLVHWSALRWDSTVWEYGLRVPDHFVFIRYLRACTIQRVIWLSCVRTHTRSYIRRCTSREPGPKALLCFCLYHCVLRLL